MCAFTYLFIILHIHFRQSDWVRGIYRVYMSPYKPSSNYLVKRPSIYNESPFLIKTRKLMSVDSLYSFAINRYFGLLLSVIKCLL